MAYPKILLKAGREHIIFHNHPWIFSNGLAGFAEQKEGRFKNGEIADIYSGDGKRFLARGYYNKNSQIAVRLLTRDKTEKIDAAFFEKRFRTLLARRERFINTKQTNAFRVVFGESDGMPGLIIDKYDRGFVMQIHTLGMELLRDAVISTMKTVFEPKTIFEKSDVGVRLQEGLPDMPVRHVWGEKLKKEIEILENGVRFLVNIKDGQKTGFFLDQRENRRALQKYCAGAAGAKILNCFCYTAGFSVYAALAGAKQTVNVDVSKEALETAKRNFSINKLNPANHRFIDGDAFDVLNEYAKKRERFDIVILDPPAFVKNQKSLTNGLNGYLFINERALQILPDGGILVSSSCSAHVTDEMFQKMLAMAASKANCGLKTLEIKHQPIDHPFNIHFPEGKYLKFYVMIKATNYE